MSCASFITILTSFNKFK